MNGPDLWPVGASASLTRVFTDAEVRLFSELSGDTNPLHLSDAYAAQTRFGQRIVHGSLVASLFSALLGTRLPGPGAIYVSQQLRFRKPVHLGAAVTASVTVRACDRERQRVSLETRALVGDDLVLEGTAEMYVPE